MSLINDGSPDVKGINIFNELLGDPRHEPLPVFWENIGSRITFTSASAEALPPITQNYPTYYRYINGKHFTAVTVQEPEPGMHFYWASYPFGTDKSTGLGLKLQNFFLPVTILGGRSGDAYSPPDASSRTPEYVAP